MMILRTACVVAAGALLVGCQSSRVMGTAAYYDDNRVIGDASYRGDRMIAAVEPSDNVKNVEATADAHTASATLDADRVRLEQPQPAANATATGRENRVVQPGWADPERAAYAATAKFPADAKAVAEVPLTASVDRDRNELVVRNDSDQALNNVNVWVNGQYVAWVGQIPSHERVTVRMQSFSDAQGHTIKDWADANSVQLQSGDRLFNTTGLEKR